MRQAIRGSSCWRRGIVYAVTGFLVAQDANILEATQFDDVNTGLFFMRVQFEMSDRSVSDQAKQSATLEAIENAFETVANPINRLTTAA